MLPAKYKFLEEIGTLPKLVSAGLQYLGVKEIPGFKNNPIIMDWASGLGISKIYKNDDMAWCGLAIAHLLRITGKPQVDVKGDPYNYLRALYYKNWGYTVPIDEIQCGDLVGLIRDGGGHIGVAIAWSKGKESIFLMGGNQRNEFNISEFKRDRISFARRYYAIAPPESAKQYFIDSTGKYSTNEA